MDNYTPNPFITQPIYDPTRPFATPNCDVLQGLTGLASHTWPHSLFNLSYSDEEISNIVEKKKKK